MGAYCEINGELKAWKECENLRPPTIAPIGSDGFENSDDATDNKKSSGSSCTINDKPRPMEECKKFFGMAIWLFVLVCVVLPLLCIIGITVAVVLIVRSNRRRGGKEDVEGSVSENNSTVEL